VFHFREHKNHILAPIIIVDDLYQFNASQSAIDTNLERGILNSVTMKVNT